jgi:hypothetical protein
MASLAKSSGGSGASRRLSGRDSLDRARLIVDPD